MNLEISTFQKHYQLTELPDERMQMTLGMYGECDFFTLKGVVEDMLDSLGLGGRSEYAPTGEHPFLHPGRAADVDDRWRKNRLYRTDPSRSYG